MRLALIILSSAWTNQKPPLGRVIASKTRPTKIAADGRWSLRNRGQFVIDNFHIPIHVLEPPLQRLLRRTRETLEQLITRRLLRFFLVSFYFLFSFLFRRPERAKRSPRRFQIHPPGTRQAASWPATCSETLGALLEDFRLHILRWVRECHGCPTWFGRRRRSEF